MKKRVAKSANKDSRKFIFILIRYLILLAAMFSLPIIYWIFTPLTSYLSFYLLKLFFNGVFIFKNTLLISPDTIIELIPACIAGSAYLLLLILNLTVPMNLKKRIFSIISSFLILLALNVIRILILSILYKKNAIFFDYTHLIFWYFLSTVFVIGIWFFTVKIFSINEIPVYTDIKYIISKTKK